MATRKEHAIQEIRNAKARIAFLALLMTNPNAAQELQRRQERISEYVRRSARRAEGGE